MAANIATVVAVFAAILILAYRLYPRSAEPPPQAPKRINMRGANAGAPAVVLVLSSRCRFCTESAGLYQRIVQAKRSDTKLIAWMPDAPSVARAYLDHLGVRADQIVRGNPAAVGTRYTPTIIVMDGSGNVRAWLVGKLTPAREAELFAELSACTSCATQSKPIGAKASHR